MPGSILILNLKKTAYDQVHFYKFSAIINLEGIMNRNFIILTALILVTLPVSAQDINMTPQSEFSGYRTKSSARLMYPHITPAEDNRAELMKPKSVHEMGNTTPVNDGKTPMTYSQFPQHYDSSYMLHTQGVQNGMQNMFMGL